MARRNDKYAQTERLRDRLYHRELERWSSWLALQDGLRDLMPRAIEVLDQTLTTGGPEAVKLSLALVRMTGLAAAVEKPQRTLLGFASEEEVLARLGAHSDSEQGILELTSG